MTRLPPDPVRHPKRQLGPCGPVQSVPDVVDQTTARIHALNDTLRAVAVSAADPNQQSKEERTARARLRREVYAELGRLVGPAERVELVKREITHAMAAGDLYIPPKAPPFDPPHPLPTDSDREEMRIGGPHAGL